MQHIARAHLALLASWALACSSSPSMRPGEVGTGADPSLAGSGDTAGRGPQDPQSLFDGGGVSSPPAAPNTPNAGPRPMNPGGGNPQMQPPTEPAPTPIAIDETGADNPAGLSASDVTKLMAGGPLGGMKWLYPYNGTVFPRGTVAPLVMWTGNSAPDAVYLHMKSQAFEYKGVLAPTIEGAVFVPADSSLAGTINNLETLFNHEPGKQLAIPQAAWDAASRQALGKTDKLRIEITERAGGQIHGPVSAEITIARGAVQGSIYYNSCVSSAASTSGVLSVASGIGSRVMRIPPGGNAQVVSSSEQCIGCHSVSADGSRLVAQRAQAVADLGDVLAGQPPIYAWSTPFTADGKPDATAATQFGTMGSYGALYPDGSKYLAASGAAGILVYANGVMPLTAATLFDSGTGAVVPDTGIPPGASMPMFSPDGTRLVFNDASRDDAHGLSIMEYDVRTHKASGLKPLLQTSGDARPGWPFFLPDNRAVVFAQTNSPDFTSGLAGLGAGNQLMSNTPFPSDLHIVDVATGTSTILARAMGYDTPEDAAAGKSYLPHADIDLHRNYFPTVSPVASGGYFWIYFDSLRHFGSLGATRGIWGAAIDIRPDGSYTTDPSHPAFFVPGQELVGSAHHRAFAALDACRPDGASCVTGIDCCAGACSDAGVCAVPPPDTCAKRDERCTADADCCPPSADSEPPNLCIAGFCAFVPLL